MVSTVSTIVKNQRYTGYATFGAFKKEEHLVDPNDPTWGYVSRHVRSKEGIIRSQEQAHPAIVTVEEWQKAQLLTAGRGTRRGARTDRKYAFQGLISCYSCGRNLQAELNKSGKTRYRCRASRDVPGSKVAASHRDPYGITESKFAPQVARWLDQLIEPDNINNTIDSLLGIGTNKNLINIRANRSNTDLVEARQRLSSLLDSVEKGMPFDLVADRLTKARADIEAAQAIIDHESERRDEVDLGRDVIEEMLTALHQVGGVAQLFKDGDPAAANAMLRSLGVVLMYDHDGRRIQVQVGPSFGPETGKTHPDVGGGYVSVSEGGLGRIPTRVRTIPVGVWLDVVCLEWQVV